MLKWKIAPDETLIYSDVLQKSESSQPLNNQTHDSLVNLPGNSLLLQDSSFMLNWQGKGLDVLSYHLSISKTAHGNLDVKLMLDSITDDVYQTVDSNNVFALLILQMLQSMPIGYQLNASVTENGDLQSFWLNQRNKNFMTLLFDLPNQPVKIGDSWTIPATLSELEESAKCTRSSLNNRVQLIDIKYLGKDTIAVLNYTIQEDLGGYYSLPAFLSKENKVVEFDIQHSFQARGEFSVTNGRWINYEGILLEKAIGSMEESKTTTFKLALKK